MRDERQLKSFKNDRLSVSDQPGWTLILVGFFISFTIGYSIKSLLAPSRIRPYIEQAAKQINKNISVRLGPIEASLSKYGLPRLALILKDIRIHNHNECYKDALLDISEIEVPLKFFSLLRGHPEINSVLIGEVELRTPKLIQNCSGLNSVVSNSNSDSVISSESLTSPQKRSTDSENATNSTQTDELVYQYKDSVLEQIQIEKLRIIALDHTEVPLELTNVQLDILNHKPQWIKLSANLGLFRDNKFSNYLTNSKIYIEYNSSKPQAFTSSLTGNIREGSYKLFTQYNPKDHFLNFDGEVKHFPLFEILRLLPKSSLTSKISETSPIWLSSRFNLSGDHKNIFENNLQLLQVKVEGDPVEFTSEKIEFLSLQPLKFQKFDIRLNKLNLDVVNRILTRPMSSKSLYTLGVLQGDVVIRSLDNIDFSGDWKNLGFIVSNKGERRVQMMNRLSLSGILREDKNLKLKLNKFEPANGGLNGEAYLQYNLVNYTTSLALELDELNLDNEIVKLLTDGGHVRNLRGQLNLEWTKNVMSKLRGFITSSEALVENVLMNMVRLELSSSMSNVKAFQAQVFVEKLEFDKNQFFILKDMLQSTDNVVQLNSSKVRQPNFIFNYNLDNSFNWKVQSLSSKKQQQISVSTSGRWTSSGQLSGNINLLSKNKTEKYSIEGTRDFPKIIRVK